MRLDDFDYTLPPEFIAQRPIEPRDEARLLILNRARGALAEHHVRDLPDLLRPGDLLVFNDTRVLPARLWARKRRTGGKVEILLLRREAAQTWEALLGGKGLKPGAELILEDPRGAPASSEGSPLVVTVEAELGGARRLIRFSSPVTPELERLGEMPLPPYIHEKLADPSRYQTVFARASGSAAAPTAGLHFTPELLERLAARGIDQTYVTLHVGLDTFAPITEAKVEEHAMHSEWMSVSREAAARVNAARAAGRRVIAIGTTSVRTLETAALEAARRGSAEALAPWEGPTRLYIMPGYTFRVVQGMLTNFHLPRSTLLLLVSAFAGRERVLAAYAEAQSRGFRFYSFGDAMLIL
jgi:S-adenosylmethionine:tRNA ribosyltransferase-isomerase